jgi:hypothetical protein
MRADMSEQYAKVTRRQVDHVLMRDRLKRIFKVDGVEDLDDDDEIDTVPQGGARDHHLSRLADLVAEASDGKLDRADALHWLLHTARGRAVAVHHKQAKGFPMPNRADELEAVVKGCGGFQKLCKAISAGRHGDITERELTLMATGYAVNRHPELSFEQAFAKRYGDPQSSDAAKHFWNACNVVTGKLAPARLEPAVTRGHGGMLPVNDPAETLRQLRGLLREQHDRTRVVDGSDDKDEDDALDELQAKAASLRKKMPQLSEAQAFAKVYQDPNNRELAKRERSQNGFSF